MKKTITTLLLGMVATMTLSGCSLFRESDKPLVIATLFPQYSFAKSLAGEYVDVELLLPIGTSPHSFEPTPQKVIKMNQADLFMYSSETLEPWVHEFVVDSPNHQGTVLDLSQNITLGEEEHEGSEEASLEDEHDHDHGVDPHYWTDPLNNLIMIDDIEAALINLLPDYQTEIASNASALKEEINQLHTDYLDLMTYATVNTIIYGGHFAFGYLAHRYGIEYVTPYSGFSLSASPNAAAIAELIDTMQLLGTNVIYSAELEGTAIANAIKDQVEDAVLLNLYPGENVSLNQWNQGLTYQAIARLNLENLKIGLGYQKTN